MCSMKLLFPRDLFPAQLIDLCAFMHLLIRKLLRHRLGIAWCRFIFKRVLLRKIKSKHPNNHCCCQVTSPFVCNHMSFFYQIVKCSFSSRHTYMNFSLTSRTLVERAYFYFITTAKIFIFISRRGNTQESNNFVCT